MLGTRSISLRFKDDPPLCALIKSQIKSHKRNYHRHPHRIFVIGVSGSWHAPIIYGEYKWLLYLIFTKDISFGNAEQQRVGNLPCSASHQNSKWLSLQWVVGAEKKTGVSTITIYLHTQGRIGRAGRHTSSGWCHHSCLNRINTYPSYFKYSLCDLSPEYVT